VITIEGGHISAINYEDQIVDNSDPDLVDCTGLCLMPGLIDCHTHTQMDGGKWIPEEIVDRSNAKLYTQSVTNVKTALTSGVTTIRDNAARQIPILKLREMLLSDQLKGPTCMVSGAAITRRDGHCWFIGITAESDEQLLAVINRQIESGVDFVKVMATGGNLTQTSNPRRAQFKLEQIKTIVRQAHQVGLKVSAHAHGTEGIYQCIEAGIDSIDHCSWLGKTDGFQFDQRLSALIAERGIYVVPTLSAIFERFSEQTEILETRLANLQAMAEMGVSIVSGTDAGVYGVPFGRPWREIELLSRSGLSNFESLRAATSKAADCLGIADRVGTLEPGKQADLIAIDGNPLEDLQVLSKIKLVMKAGEIVFTEVDSQNLIRRQDG
jgi:imidazolonepropionase-like amidohydrolase